MKYTLHRPCNNCPFLKKGGVRLRRSRVLEIAGDERGEFACHKTTVSTGDGDRRETDNSLHCAGALIFHEKTETPTQMMRIAERIGMYDAEALMKDPAVVALVFDSMSDMLRANAKGTI